MLHVSNVLSWYRITWGSTGTKKTVARHYFSLEISDYYQKNGLCYKMSYSLSFYPHNSTNPAPCYDTEAVWNSLTWPSFQITLVDRYTLPNSFGLYQPNRKTLLQMLNISISTLVYTQSINYWLVFAWHGVTTLHCLIRFSFKQT